MKKFTRITSMLICAALCVSAALPVFADDETVNETETIEATEVETTTEETAVETTGIVLALGSADARKEGKTAIVNGGMNGEFEDSETDGVKAVKVRYSDHANLGKYRVAPRFDGTNRIDESYKYVRIVYKTDSKKEFDINFINNATWAKVKLDTVKKDNAGKWVCSDPVDITPEDMQKRFIDGKHSTLEFFTEDSKLNIYVYEIVFFKTEEEAKAYKCPIIPEVTEEDGETEAEIDEEAKKKAELEEFKRKMMLLMIGMMIGRKDDPKPPVEPVDPIDPVDPVDPVDPEPSIDYISISFDSGANINSNGNCNYTINSSEGSVDISFSASPAIGLNYSFMPTFGGSGKISTDYKYIRVCYSAKNPDGVSSCQMKLLNNASWEGCVLESSVTDTDGFVLTGAVAIDGNDLIGRFSRGLHNTLGFDVKADGGLYQIKGIYFFKTEADANAFELN